VGFVLSYFVRTTSKPQKISCVLLALTPPRKRGSTWVPFCAVAN